MSLQELEPSGEPHSEGTQQAEGKPSRLEWFKATFPTFWTPKIIEARNAGAALQRKKKPQTWRSVARNIRGTTSNVSLHINLKEQSYRLVCAASMREWQILEATLLQATSHGSTWVNVRLGDDSLKLNRAELLAAYNYLKSQV